MTDNKEFAKAYIDALLADNEAELSELSKQVEEDNENKLAKLIAVKEELESREPSTDEEKERYTAIKGMMDLLIAQLSAVDEDKDQSETVQENTDSTVEAETAADTDGTAPAEEKEAEQVAEEK